MKRSTLKKDLIVECPLCHETKPSYQFMTLSKCNHMFCKPCLKRYFSFNGTSVARCPYQDCDQPLEKAEKQDILTTEKVGTSIQRSTPIKKQNRFIFWKKEKASSETEKDIDYSSNEIVVAAEMPSDPLDDCWMPSNLKTKEALSAVPKTDDFPRLPETATAYSSTQQYSNDFDDPASKTLKKDEIINNSKMRISDNEPEVSSNTISKVTTDITRLENGNFRNESIATTSESYVLINLESVDAQDSYHLVKNKQPKEWDVQSRIQLQQLIKERYHKVIDFMFLAIEADISLNTNPVECLQCHEQISTYEGVTFPYCFYWFCRTCLTTVGGTFQKNYADEIVLLYSNSSIPNKNCAIILDPDIMNLLNDHGRFAQLRKEFMLKKTILIPDLNNYPTLKQCNPVPDELGINNTYQDVIGSSMLTNLSEVALLRNSSSSTCLKCTRDILAGKGVILRDCFHVLCEQCTIQTIMETLDFSVEVRCPMILDDKRRCKTIIQEREINSLLSPEQYGKYERKCLQAAQHGFETSAQCFKPNCIGLVFFEGYKERFICPVCGNENCLSCKAIHNGKSCSGHIMQQERNFNKNVEPTKRCPECKRTTTNEGVNNFIRCSHCKYVFNQPKRKSKKWF